MRLRHPLGPLLSGSSISTIQCSASSETEMMRLRVTTDC